jgi:hypothetical protein
MTPTDPPRIRINQPGELIEAIPYLLGFHPHESLVMVGFGPEQGVTDGVLRVQLALRVDLPRDPLTPAELQPVLAALLRSSVTAVVVLLVTCADAADPAVPTERVRPQAESVQNAAQQAGLSVMDVLVADEHRWWSLLCRDEECCPAAGTPRTRDRSAAAAEATYAGLVALPDRDAVAGQFSGRSAATRQVLEPLLERAERRIAEAVLSGRDRRLVRADTNAILKAAARLSVPRQAPAQSEPAGALLGPLSDRQVARFGAALCDIDIRDAVWLAIDDASLDAVELLAELFRRLPAPYDAAPLFLYGWHQWRQGSGTVAAMAAERALASDPGYSAAQLLLSAVHSGLDPRSTPTLSSRPDGAVRAGGIRA